MLCFPGGREIVGASFAGLKMFEREVGNSGWLPLASFPPNVIKVETHEIGHSGPKLQQFCNFHERKQMLCMGYGSHHYQNRW